MKKLIIIALLLMIPTNVKAVSARNMVVMDTDTKRVLYNKDMNDPHLIASITKIMTCIIALENKNSTDVVEIGDEILTSFGSGIYITIGEKITLNDLLYGLMLRSGNDAALAIAKYVGGSVDEFVGMMNIYAKKIGMKNTVFINPHGLEDKNGKGNTSTAYDMALLTSYAMQNEEYKKIVSTKKYVSKSDQKTYSWTNKNKLLNTYSYTTGGKTGFTEKARRTLVSTASKDGKNIAIVTLNDPNDWTDHKDMYEEIFENYESKKIVDKNNFKVDKDEYYKEHTLYIKNDIYVTLKKDEDKNISINIILDKLPKFETDDKVGIIEIKLNDNILKTENIYVQKKSENKPKINFFQKIIGWFK